MLKLSAESFTGTRLLDAREILAAFYADWCPFCTSFLVVFEAAMKKTKEPLGALVDVSDTDNPLWEVFELNIVPTLVGFKDEKATVRKDGVPGLGLGMPELEDAILRMQRSSQLGKDT